MRKLLFILLLAASLPLAAEQEQALEPPLAAEQVQVLEPLNAPALPQTGPVGEELEPEVRIIKKDSATIEEYRMNGALYMVKITPAIGLPYYLIDADGDGKLESRYNKLDPGLMVPQWMIYRW